MRTKARKILKYTIFGGIATGAGVILYLTFKTNVKADDARRYAPKHFSFDDLFKSATATRNGIDNTTDDEDIKNNLKALCKAVIDPAIDEYKRLYGGDIKVSSGYRSPAVNYLVGGAVESQHLKGEAIDVTTGSKDGNKRLFDIVKSQNRFDQLIDEKDMSWCHISFKRTGYNRQQTLIL